MDELETQSQCRHMQAGRQPFHRVLGFDSKDSRYRNFTLTISYSRCRNQVTTCSDFTSEATLWTKEVEMVNSTDESKSSRSVAGKKFPNFELLNAKIASAFNKIIENFHFEKNVSLKEQKAQKEDRFLRGRQIAFMIYDNFRVTCTHDTVLDYADLFSVTFHDDNVQELNTRWDESSLSMTKIPSDDILKVCTN